MSDNKDNQVATTSRDKGRKGTMIYTQKWMKC
jgi:hypothetical protein